LLALGHDVLLDLRFEPVQFSAGRSPAAASLEGRR
jgi:hypothetical protein